MAIRREIDESFAFLDARPSLRHRIINEIKGENTVIINAIKLLTNDELSSHGIHILLRKYGHK